MSSSLSIRRLLERITDLTLKLALAAHSWVTAALRALRRMGLMISATMVIHNVPEAVAAFAGRWPMLGLALDWG
jgi:HAMP domain-containing protein